MPYPKIQHLTLIYKNNKFSGMGMQKHYKSTVELAKMLRALTEKYYEPGNNSRCYKAVWRKYIYPVYPICYRTYLNYLDIPTPPPPKRPTPLQLSLFEFFDENDPLH